MIQFKILVIQKLLCKYDKKKYEGWKDWSLAYPWREERAWTLEPET